MAPFERSGTMTPKQKAQEKALEKKALRGKNFFEKMDYGIRRGVARAQAEAKKAGMSIVISKNGKIIKIPPEKIKIPKEFKYLLEK